MTKRETQLPQILTPWDFGQLTLSRTEFPRISNPPWVGAIAEDQNNKVKMALLMNARHAHMLFNKQDRPWTLLLTAINQS